MKSLTMKGLTRRSFSSVVAGLLTLSMTAGLTGCDSSSETAGASAEGRTRLNINDSFGEFGEYVVHINAMTSAGLTPEVAKNYEITRSENNGLINLVVLRQSEGIGTGKPVKADVTVSAANLTGQLKTMNLTQIEEGESIYYIGLVSIDDRETINFDFDLVPDGTSQNLPLRFSHKFHTR